MKFNNLIGLALLTWLSSVGAQTSPEASLLAAFDVNTNGQSETTAEGSPVNSTYSLRAGPRGYVLLEDTVGRKKLQHFDRERQPERVVHALGNGAFGTFTSYADWSNITSACWLKGGATSDVFTRFSVVVAGVGGADTGRDTHGFATKIYSQCGNHDLVGNHISSFFINDGILFPDLIHSVKAEADKGFPTGGSAHTTAYDFFTQRPEGAFQLMNVLSDTGIPRDVRHFGGNGVHTYRFINDAGKSTLFKWYWKPLLGYRAFVYDEATKIAGKNNNFHRADLWNSIEAGMYPEWELSVQMFPDDGTYMYKGIDLLDPTQVVPFEILAPTTLGKMTLNRNPTNFFAETESIQFAPSNVVRGVTFVPDPLLQWRLMSYDDTATHRHASPNIDELPVNRPIVAVDNNYRDGPMQFFLYEGISTSSPNGIDGVHGSSDSESISYGSENVNGKIGRYGVFNDPFTQARTFWYGLDPYAQQHTVDAYRFELGHVADANVTENYINGILNNIDNCLARRVAFGVGATMPNSGSKSVPNVTFPSQYPLGSKESMPVTGLIVGLLADDSTLSSSDYSAITTELMNMQVMFEVVAPHQGTLKTGVFANQSYITTSSIFYDALIIGGSFGNDAMFGATQMEFVREGYGHGKPIGELNNNSTGTTDVLSELGYTNSSLGVFRGSNAKGVADMVLNALATPRRYPERQPLDDVKSICG